MKKQKNIAILFSGLSLNNTPKINLLIENLEEDGYNVCLYGIVKSVENHKLKKWSIYSKKEYQGFFKILYVLFLQFKILLRLIFKEEAEYIYAINPVSGIVAWIASILTPKKFFYESHEMIFGLDYPFFKGHWRFFWVPIEKLIISRSRKFITTDAFRMAFYRRYYNLPEDKMLYLMNVPKLEKKKASCKLKNQLGCYQKYIISYCGGIMQGRNIEEIIHAFSEVKDKIDNSFLLLAGTVSPEYKDKLKDLLKDLCVEPKYFLFTGEVTNEKLKEYMQISDVTFALYDKLCLNNRMCSPNKIFDAIHLETQLICSASPLTNEIIAKNSAGFVISETSINALKSALLRCYDLKDDHKTDFALLKEKYNWSKEFWKLKKAFAGGLGNS